MRRSCKIIQEFTQAIVFIIIQNIQILYFVLYKKKLFYARKNWLLHKKLSMGPAEMSFIISFFPCYTKIIWPKYS
jgi:c-di-GMP-related signal transduction protein